MFLGWPCHIYILGKTLFVALGEMGQPIPFPCASPLCQTVHSTAEGGMFFSAQQIFQKTIGGSTQLWACCLDHKREALQAILKDLPFRHSKRGPR